MGHCPRRGALKLRVTESPWNMAFFDSEGNPVLVVRFDHGRARRGLYDDVGDALGDWLLSAGEVARSA
jgi:hypothetical protein